MASSARDGSVADVPWPGTSAGPPAERDVAGAVVEAARVVHALGLATAFGHVSARVTPGVALVTGARTLGAAAVDDLIEVDVDADRLPPGAPPETWLHLAVYAARPDVAAVVRAMPPASFGAGLTAGRLTPLHGQGAWLGEVAVHPDPCLLRSPDRARAAADRLGDGSALVLRGNGALAVGASPAQAVTRLWVLESTCRLHLQAPRGSPGLSPEQARGWAEAGGPLLQRLWDYLRGAVDDPAHPARRRPLA